MKLTSLLKTASVEANTLAACAAFGLLVKIFVLNRYEEVLPGAYEIGIVIEGLLASIIASYIFYIIVVHLKEQSDKAVLGPYLSQHSKRIVGECRRQLNDISKASNLALDLNSLDEESIKLAFSRIAPYSQAPLIIGDPGSHANWFQYFIFHNTRSQEDIRKLFAQLPFLKAQHIKLISDIDDCPHFWSVKAMEFIRRVSNPDLTAWAGPFYSYCASCRKLDEFNCAEEALAAA